MEAFDSVHARPAPFWRNGPQPGGLYNFSNNSTTSRNTSESQRSAYPVVTGTSVLGLKFNGGVIIAADMLGSYGSLARFRNISRLNRVNDSTVIGCGGDYADYQFLKSVIEQRVIDEECLDDGFGFTPKSMFSWLTRVLYNRRSKFNPLWNVYVVAGLQDEEPFLGYIDKIGVAYESPSISSGFGSHIALPILREEMEKNPNMNEKDATELIQRCMKLLYYRDARSLNKYQYAVITKAGAKIHGPIVPESNWEIAHLIQGYE
ncbi:hypothetical protein LOTGIDRAFT_230810 [Lottia gigantea]|uniref:Proteasome subunit beta n=1 Tax=Lottia gigantea TaxID=225164 RepID=V4A971_LOTGI|nr:hypothetical protein LOTGIDRAFT_230810 [Lottia gigantea]ESP00519.1 hypothetical protein LOTGIDRAFT_230810 [Lottia gigantea]